MKESILNQSTRILSMLQLEGRWVTISRNTKMWSTTSEPKSSSLAKRITWLPFLLAEFSFLLLIMNRIESIGSLEFYGKSGSLQRKQITLVDDDGVKLKFLLWGEQVLLANLFRWYLELDIFFFFLLYLFFFYTSKKNLTYFQCWKYACTG